MSRKRKLSNDEIERLLLASDSSASEIDSDDSKLSSSDTDVEQKTEIAKKIAEAMTVMRLRITIGVGGSTFVWSGKETSVRCRLPFTGIPGRRVPVSDTTDPLEYFNLFITDNMIDGIVTETNKRARQLMQSTRLKRRSRLNDWVDVTCNELKVLFAMFIYQGIIQKPEIEMFWSTKPLLETPYVRKIMTEKRY
jgi:hypothetical protein